MPIMHPVFHCEPFSLHLQYIELLQVPFCTDALLGPEPFSLPVSFPGLEAP